MANENTFGTEMITVACKLPNGLHLDLSKDGQRTRFTLRGNALPRGADRDDSKEYPRVIGGFALTEIPKLFWDAWFATHKEIPAVRNGLIFARAKPADTAAMAAEKAELRSGMEPLDPKKPAKDIAKLEDAA